ncbi:hypothetical protein AMECASPLE_018825 [Ameca splendens]|uniref:Uncharacterized protein n=1 Tax=Ameca splendens TaxID=208324 RepID=A0ABV0ZYJ5_9TELE
MKLRCNPESSDGCNAGQTSSAERRKPVVEVMIQSPQEAWNEKPDKGSTRKSPINPLMSSDIKDQAGVIHLESQRSGKICFMTRLGLRTHSEAVESH